jgi:acyl-CoA synthetase (AMP-forming)/AMP-acid ligase II
MPLEGATLTPPAHLLDAVLRVGLDADPDGAALASADGEMSWRALDLASARLAGGYRELGIVAGDRVASLMPNRADVIVHYLACLKSGIVGRPPRVMMKAGMRSLTMIVPIAA